MATAIASCSYPTNESPYPGECNPLHPIAFVPLPNSVGVPIDVTFRIKFDDYPDPDTVRSDSLLLTSGFFWVPGSYGVDLIDRTAVITPIHPLVRGLGYSLHLRPALSSLAGCPGTSQEIEFITGQDAANVSPPAPVKFETVQRIFTARCGGSACHLSDDAEGGCLPAPAAGLSLCAAQAWDALVAVPSRQTTKLQLVQAGDSARSYLLRKLLPARSTGGPISGVYGQREPPGPPLPEGQLRAVAAWIDGGATR